MERLSKEYTFRDTCGEAKMTFPEFMFSPKNRIPESQQNTPDIEGYYYTANDGSQMAFWTYKADRDSKEHRHGYDEWMLCVEGEYTVTIDGKEHTLHAGDELFIPKGSLQGGRVKAGTRSIHAFGGMRICPFQIVDYTDKMKEELFAFLSDEFAQAGKAFEPNTRHTVYQDIHNNFLLFLCMKDRNKIIGTIALKKLNEANCELKTMYLNKNYQGRKLGYKLAVSAIDFAKSKGFKRIYLDSMTQYDKALRLYRSLGFKETDRYNDNEMADVFMLLDL